MKRGVPYDKFVKTWNTPEPPAHLPYMGCWGDDVTAVYGSFPVTTVGGNGDVRSPLLPELRTGGLG